MTPNKKKYHAGGAMIEFAIILPFLMLIFAGIVEYGFYIKAQNSLDKAVRDAARYYSDNINKDDLATGNNSATTTSVTNTATALVTSNVSNAGVYVRCDNPAIVNIDCLHGVTSATSYATTSCASLSGLATTTLPEYVVVEASCDRPQIVTALFNSMAAIFGSSGDLMPATISAQAVMVFP